MSEKVVVWQRLHSVPRTLRCEQTVAGNLFGFEAVEDRRAASGPGRPALGATEAVCGVRCQCSSAFFSKRRGCTRRLGKTASVPGSSGNWYYSALSCASPRVGTMEGRRHLPSMIAGSSEAADITRQTSVANAWWPRILASHLLCAFARTAPSARLTQHSYCVSTLDVGGPWPKTTDYVH